MSSFPQFFIPKLETTSNIKIRSSSTYNQCQEIRPSGTPVHLHLPSPEGDHTARLHLFLNPSTSLVLPLAWSTVIPRLQFGVEGSRGYKTLGEAQHQGTLTVDLEGRSESYLVIQNPYRSTIHFKIHTHACHLDSIEVSDSKGGLRHPNNPKLTDLYLNEYSCIRVHLVNIRSCEASLTVAQTQGNSQTTQETVFKFAGRPSLNVHTQPTCLKPCTVPQVPTVHVTVRGLTAGQTARLAIGGYELTDSVTNGIHNFTIKDELCDVSQLSHRASVPLKMCLSVNGTNIHVQKDLRLDFIDALRITTPLETQKRRRKGKNTKSQIIHHANFSKVSDTLEESNEITLQLESAADDLSSLSIHSRWIPSDTYAAPLAAPSSHIPSVPEAPQTETPQGTCVDEEEEDSVSFASSTSSGEEEDPLEEELKTAVEAEALNLDSCSDSSSSELAPLSRPHVEMKASLNPKSPHELSFRIQKHLHDSLPRSFDGHFEITLQDEKCPLRRYVLHSSPLKFRETSKEVHFKFKQIEGVFEGDELSVSPVLTEEPELTHLVFPTNTISQYSPVKPRNRSLHLYSVGTGFSDRPDIVEQRALFTPTTDAVAPDRASAAMPSDEVTTHQPTGASSHADDLIQRDIAEVSRIPHACTNLLEALDLMATVSSYLLRLPLYFTRSQSVRDQLLCTLFQHLLDAAAVLRGLPVPSAVRMRLVEGVPNAALALSYASQIQDDDCDVASFLSPLFAPTMFTAGVQRRNTHVIRSIVDSNFKNIKDNSRFAVTKPARRSSHEPHMSGEGGSIDHYSKWSKDPRSREQKPPGSCDPLTGLEGLKFTEVEHYGHRSGRGTGKRKCRILKLGTHQPGSPATPDSHGMPMPSEMESSRLDRLKQARREVNEQFLMDTCGDKHLEVDTDVTVDRSGIAALEIAEEDEDDTMHMAAPSSVAPNQQQALYHALYHSPMVDLAKKAQLRSSKFEMDSHDHSVGDPNYFEGDFNLKHLPYYKLHQLLWQMVANGFNTSPMQAQVQYSELCLLVPASQSLADPKSRGRLFTLLVWTVACCEYYEIPFSVVVFAGKRAQILLKRVDEQMTAAVGQRVLDAIVTLSTHSEARVGDAMLFSQHAYPDARFIAFTDGLTSQIACPESIAGITTPGRFVFLRSPNLAREKTSHIKTRLSAIRPLLDLSKLHGELVALLRVPSSSSQVTSGQVQPVLEAYEFGSGFCRAQYRLNAPVGCIDDIGMVQSSDRMSTPSKHVVLNNITQVTQTLNLNMSAIRVDSTRPALDLWATVQREMGPAAHSLSTVLGENFLPTNKATRLVPSNSGNVIMMQGLIRFLLTKGSYRKIFGRKTGGMVRRWGCVVVLDMSSSSAASQRSMVELMITLITALDSLRIQSVSVVLASTPTRLVKAFDQPLDQQTKTMLLSAASAHGQSDVASALQVAAALFEGPSAPIGSRATLLLSDGVVLSRAEELKIQEAQQRVRFSGSSYLAITTGRAGVSSSLAPLAWSASPQHIGRAVQQLMLNGSELPSRFSPETVSECRTELQKQLTRMADSRKVYDLRLQQYLRQLPDPSELINRYINSVGRDMRSFSSLPTRESANGVRVMDNPDAADLGKDNAFKGFKVLVVFLFAPPADEAGDITTECLKHNLSSIERQFGFQFDIVHDFKSAIESLDTGEYSSCWVICSNGPINPRAKCPFTGLRGLFVQRLVLFHNHGGGLAIFADNEPITVELNLFCRIWGVTKGKNLTFSGNYEGCGYLTAQSEVDIRKSRLSGFPRSRGDEEKYPYITHGLNSVYEGETICKPSLSPAELEALGIRILANSTDAQHSPTILTYHPPREHRNAGRVVLDTGFTRLFYEFQTAGTGRYLKNLAVWIVTAGLTRGEEPLARIRRIETKIPESPGMDSHFHNSGSATHFVILVDRSGSMGSPRYHSPIVGIRQRTSVGAALEGVYRILEKRVDGDRVTIIGFNSGVTTPIVNQPADPSLVFQVHFDASGGTSFSTALREAIRYLRPRDQCPINQQVLLLSDGHASFPAREVQQMRAMGVSINTIFYGQVYPGYYGGGNTTLLKRIANDTGGSLTTASNPRELVEAFVKCSKRFL
eukprot:gnl/Dysnectes_brevis/4009_a5231_615.p1 GENE.gnl/Dysnectes_brevis/4009_a5231_615~~gnl/Dysnectes_brevis/4009_a5231_615.p1  ORF type:complete len:2391 (+),score=362.52 gnl/Dysnectes_brevis/4009_a5231_615:914-7174(+)